MIDAAMLGLLVGLVVGIVALVVDLFRLDWEWRDAVVPIVLFPIVESALFVVAWSLVHVILIG